MGQNLESVLPADKIASILAGARDAVVDEGLENSENLNKVGPVLLSGANSTIAESISRKTNAPGGNFPSDRLMDVDQSAVEVLSITTKTLVEAISKYDEYLVDNPAECPGETPASCFMTQVSATGFGALSSVISDPTILGEAMAIFAKIVVAVVAEIEQKAGEADLMGAMMTGFVSGFPALESAGVTIGTSFLRNLTAMVIEELSVVYGDTALNSSVAEVIAGATEGLGEIAGLGNLSGLNSAELIAVFQSAITQAESATGIALAVDVAVAVAEGQNHIDNGGGAHICGNGIVETGEDCDGNGNGIGGETNFCNDDCTTAVCGDGKRNTTDGEECDDSNNDAGDGCSAACTIECGNGIVDPNEDCDGDGAGHGGETALCNGDCTAAACGDGKRNKTDHEECDDGNPDNGDGCSAQCFVERGVLKMFLTANAYPSGWGSDLAIVDGYCNADGNNPNSGNYRAMISDGANRVATANGTDFSGQKGWVIYPNQVYTQANGSTPVGTSNIFGLLPSGILANGFDSLSFNIWTGMNDDMTAGDTCVNNSPWSTVNEEPWSSVADPFTGATGLSNGSPDYFLFAAPCYGSMRLVCVEHWCGNGIVDPGEDCDGDGAGNGGETATCDYDCTLSACGDGLTNTSAGEDCDDGNAVLGDACDNACNYVVECGNGVITPDEECDDGNSISGDGCSSACTVDALRIFKTANVYPSGWGSDLSIVDGYCNTDPAKPTTGTYAALIVDGVNRVATTNGSDATGQTGWVLLANQIYIKTDEINAVGATNSFGFFNSTTRIAAAITNPDSYLVWTGMNADMTTAANTCNAWQSIDGIGTYFGAVGDSGVDSASGLFYNGNDEFCDATYPLICVEQP